jgi:predicted nucleotidyltransferase
MGFLECIRAWIELVDELRERIHSLVLFGSYIRGDFIEGVSDLDFFVVMREGSHDTIIPRLSTIIEGCTEHVGYILVDMPWEYLENLDDPLNKGYPFKFLTFYQEDFIENHLIVYGEEVVNLLPRYDWRGLLRWRAERLMSNIERDRDRPEMLRIGAGEVIRMMAAPERRKEHQQKRRIEHSRHARRRRGVGDLLGVPGRKGAGSQRGGLGWLHQVEDWEDFGRVRLVSDHPVPEDSYGGYLALDGVPYLQEAVGPAVGDPRHGPGGDDVPRL